MEADLPANGVMGANAWHYSTLDFLPWINRLTWASEWQKYKLPVIYTLTPRPITRIVT